MFRLYRYFYTLPDGTKLYQVDTCCTTTPDPSEAKHYVIEDPDEQLETIRENFQEIYSSTGLKNFPVDQINVDFEEVPEGDMRPSDHIRLKDPFSLAGLTVVAVFPE